MGVDMATQEELIASRMNVDQIARQIGADSLGYLSLQGLTETTGAGERGHCLACFSGCYPVAAADGTGKRMFERQKAVT